MYVHMHTYVCTYTIYPQGSHLLSSQLSRSATVSPVRPLASLPAPLTSRSWYPCCSSATLEGRPTSPGGWGPASSCRASGHWCLPPLSSSLAGTYVYLEIPNVNFGNCQDTLSCTYTVLYGWLQGFPHTLAKLAICYCILYFGY